MDYQKEIEEILKESKEEIKQRTKEAIKEKIIDNLNWKLGSVIGDIVEKVIKEDLEEEIKATINEYKQEVLDGIKPAFTTIGVEMAKTMETKAIKNLQDNWYSKDIIENLFK